MSEFRSINREISWLSFNHRVLQEAQNDNVPLIERLVFLGIVSSNLDEFFRVRVATIKRLAALGNKGKEGYEDDPELVLEEIHNIVSFQQKEFEKTYAEIIKKLEKENIFIDNEKTLSKKHEKFVKNYYYQKVKPACGPIMLDQANEFPQLKDKDIYLAVKLKSGLRKKYYSLIRIPSSICDRFLVLPKEDNEIHIILLDDIIRFMLHDLFPSYEFDTAEAYTVKFTRDAELDIDNDVQKGFLEKMSKSLKKRSKGDPVRVVYDESMPVDLLRYITDKMGIMRLDQMLPGGRYHNFKDFMKFPRVGGAHLQNEKQIPLLHKDFESQNSLLKTIRKKDVLLHYPYHSFNYFTNLIREAAIDKKVSAIRMTAYRLADKSQVVDALINAKRNGKKVVVFIELMARFDEKANIKWTKKLEEEGIEVHYGLEGYKVHSKIIQISRKEKGENKYYTCIGTGNFNESTAKIYSDHTLFTYDQSIGISVRKVFSIVEKKRFDFKFSKLWVSPINLRDKFITSVDLEIKKAKAGKSAEIFLKVNNLIDKEIIEKLYEASNAGVNIRLIVRGILGIIPGVKGQSENINAISIVDKYLEHSRIFVFGADKSEVVISSADLMTRNLDHRVEVATPIYDQEIQKELVDFMEIQWSDSIKARKWEEGLTNEYINKGKGEIRSQIAIYEYLTQNSPDTEEVLVK
jgi:polyphosphate kinase